MNDEVLAALHQSELRGYLNLSGLSGIISEDALRSSSFLRGQVLLYLDIAHHSLLLASSTRHRCRSLSLETMLIRMSSGRDRKSGA